MQVDHLQYYCCPITQQQLELTILKKSTKTLDGIEVEIIEEGILTSAVCFYPIIKGIPRLIVEAVIDYRNFLQQHIEDFEVKEKALLNTYGNIINTAVKKNKRTKESFKFEWTFFNYDKDKTWNAAPEKMFDRFLAETDEVKTSLHNKLILDVGCGNGLLDGFIANEHAKVIAFDFSLSIEKAFEQNTNSNVIFVQADVQYPPFKKNIFDIVQASGILIHTNNTKNSFNCLTPLVKPNGKLSCWLYHPRKDFIHNTFNFIRRLTSKLPLILYAIFLFPISFIIKKLKGNKQNSREMMVDILDWMTPEYRWEHTPDEATSWFIKNNFTSVKVTTTELFGFNIIGIKL
jgi:2-polyprenyl-3-methyl-5-hydroxy-6-metoxy-1,4-benzoquinol methylase/uncharacterized protein YbaR (Trm112 family)